MTPNLDPTHYELYIRRVEGRKQASEREFRSAFFILFFFAEEKEMKMKKNQNNSPGW